MPDRHNPPREPNPGLPGKKAGTTPVIYIHPPKQGIGYRVDETISRAYGIMPVGVAALANLLVENGIPVLGLNYGMEMALRPSFNLQSWLESLQGARIILVDLHWYEHCFGSLEMVKFCKQILPWAWTVIGGLTASGFSQEILENFPEVDFTIRGDAEQPLLALVQRLLDSNKTAGADLDLDDIHNLSYRKEGKVIHTQGIYVATTQELDRLDFANIEFLMNYRDYLGHEYLVTDVEKARQAMSSGNPIRGRWLCTARGCIYHCSYCGGSKDAHKKLANRMGLVVRSPSRIVDDLLYLQNQGVQQAALSYDIAELGEAYWQELFSEMRTREVKIGLYNEFFQSPDVRFIQALAQSVDMTHTCVAMSPLSGNERVRRLNGKHYSTDKLFDVLEALNEYNFNIFVYFSMNLPGETEATFKETLELAKQIYDFYPSSLLKILDTVHTLDPFSPMLMSPDKYGIETNMRTFMDWYQYCKNTLKGDAAARTEQWRGFILKDKDARSLKRMADAWDAARQGKEKSWWPIPPSW